MIHLAIKILVGTKSDLERVVLKKEAQQIVFQSNLTQKYINAKMITNC